MTSKNKKYRIAGIFLILGLLVNPWLVSWLLKIEFSLTFFSMLLGFSILLIVLGWGFMYKKKEFIPWFSEKYRELAVILLNMVILFALLNVIAAAIIKKPLVRKPNTSYFYQPHDLYTDSLEFMRDIYPGKTDEDINELLLLTSPYANHPVLEFQERVQSSKHYNTGFEGIRYDGKVTRQNAPTLINGAIWVLGGSTTFGQGVSDNETVSAYLNKLDTANTYINFGVHAYHQTNEIEKLLLLLKKGYQPKKVIFIDGLNDLIRMIETNFHPVETPALAKSAYTSDYNIATKQTRSTLLMQLPLTKWIRSIIDDGQDNVKVTELPWNKFDNVYDPDNLYNTNPSKHFRSTILRSPYNDIDTMGLNYVTLKLKEFYRSNYVFLSKISRSYGFEFAVFYQPQGILSPGNPFWKDLSTSHQTPLYRNFAYIVPEISRQLEQWNFPEYHDITMVQDSCTGCYVDLTHYNPELNKMIAQAILKSDNLSLSSLNDTSIKLSRPWKR